MEYTKANKKAYDRILEDIEHNRLAADINRARLRYGTFIEEHKALYQRLETDLQNLRAELEVYQRTNGKQGISKGQFAKAYRELVRDFKRQAEGKVVRSGLFRKTSLVDVVEKEAKKAAVILFLVSVYFLSKSSGLSGAAVGTFFGIDYNALYGFLFLAIGLMLLAKH